MKERAITGIQPSGRLHLGNYFGSIKQIIELQDDFPGECFCFIADYHAMTTIKDGKLLKEYTKNLIIDLLALGIDPTKTIIYKQSDVKEVCELMWILSNVTNKGLLERNHTNKEKIDKTVGLFLYPELMAADILGVGASVIPVGKDQFQHIEIVQNIASSFNVIFCETFIIPKAKVNSFQLLPGIDGRKMSKSYNNIIPLFCDDIELDKKIASIKTSSTPKGKSIIAKQEIIYQLYSCLASKKDVIKMEEDFINGILGYFEAKQILKNKIKEYFAPFKEKRKELLLDGDYVNGVTELCGKRVRDEFKITLEKVYKAVGLK